MDVNRRKAVLRMMGVDCFMLSLIFVIKPDETCSNLYSVYCAHCRNVQTCLLEIKMMVK